jgi:type IV secretory pathway TrbD component
MTGINRRRQSPALTHNDAEAVASAARSDSETVLSGQGDQPARAVLWLNGLLATVAGATARAWALVAIGGTLLVLAGYWTHTQSSRLRRRRSGR